MREFPVMTVAARLRDLGITLPQPAAPAANYAPYVLALPQLYISGQLPVGPKGLEAVGKVGLDLSVEQAVLAARLAGINIIAQIGAALSGDFERVVRVVRLGGFVNCIDGFGDQPKIINGASDLMVEVFGDAGRHSRAAVGTNALPFNASVEIDAIVLVR